MAMFRVLLRSNPQNGVGAAPGSEIQLEAHDIFSASELGYDNLKDQVPQPHVYLEVRKVFSMADAASAPPTPPLSHAGRQRISEEELESRIRAAQGTGQTWSGLILHLRANNIAISDSRMRSAWKLIERRLSPQ